MGQQRDPRHPRHPRPAQLAPQHHPRAAGAISSQFKDVYQSRIGDLGAFVRYQGDAHFDVLASDERPDVTGQIHASDFRDVHKLLERFYRVILIDTGNNMRAENWLAAADAADLLVVTSTVREDTGYSGLWMLDALQDAGYQNLKYKTVTVLSDPSPTVDTKLAADLVEVYQQRTRGRVPRALRPGAGGRVGGPVQPALGGHPSFLAAGLCGDGLLHSESDWRRRMPIRVAQWATGGVGRAAIEDVVAHPDLELVGCWVHSAEKHGRDVGEILDREPLGVTATSNVGEILALDADCVVYAPLVPNDDEVTALLRSGKNVVTPVGWMYPDPERAAPSRVRAARAGSPCTARASTPAASPSGSR